MRHLQPPPPADFRTPALAPRVPPPPAAAHGRLHRAYSFVSEGNYRVARMRGGGLGGSLALRTAATGTQQHGKVRRTASAPRLRTRSAEGVFPPRHASNRQYVPDLLSLDAAIAREAAKCER